MSNSCRQLRGLELRLLDRHSSPSSLYELAESADVVSRVVTRMDSLMHLIVVDWYSYDNSLQEWKVGLKEARLLR